MKKSRAQQAVATSIGYGNDPFESFLERLQTHEIEYLVDVRSSATSRQAEFNGDALQRLLARESITYLDLGSALGGRPNDPSCYRDGHVDYDRCSERPVFREALDRLVTGMEQGRRIALMCSEIDPERCHRSKLIGVELAKKDIEMTHIDRDGSLATQEKVIKRITGGQETLFGEGFQSRAKYDQPDDEPTRP